MTAIIMLTAPYADSGSTCMKPVMVMLIDTVKSNAGPAPIKFCADEV